MASSNLNWDCFGFGPEVLIESRSASIIDFLPITQRVGALHNVHCFHRQKSSTYNKTFIPSKNQEKTKREMFAHPIVGADPHTSKLNQISRAQWQPMSGGQIQNNTKKKKEKQPPSSAGGSGLDWVATSKAAFDAHLTLLLAALPSAANQQRIIMCNIR